MPNHSFGSNCTSRSPTLENVFPVSAVPPTTARAGPIETRSAVQRSTDSSAMRRTDKSLTFLSHSSFDPTSEERPPCRRQTTEVGNRCHLRSGRLRLGRAVLALVGRDDHARLRGLAVDEAERRCRHARRTGVAPYRARADGSAARPGRSACAAAASERACRCQDHDVVARLLTQPGDGVDRVALEQVRVLPWERSMRDATCLSVALSTGVNGLSGRPGRRRRSPRRCVGRRARRRSHRRTCAPTSSGPRTAWPILHARSRPDGPRPAVPEPASRRPA